MPLPDGDLAWPPAPIADLLPTMHEWGVWYEGNPDNLKALYSGGRGGGLQERAGQRRGGVAGRLSRWWWGQPSPDGTQRPKLHVPLASDIASASADLLFGESVSLDAPELGEGEQDNAPDSQAMDRLTWLLEQIGWEALLLEAADVCSGVGGAYLRVVWDATLAPHPLVTTAHADQAWPVFRYGRLQSVVFWHVIEADATSQSRIRLLEEHAPGRINYGLYRGSTDRLGRRVPLTEHAATAGIEVDDESGVETGYPGLTAVYVPNMRPARGWRHHGVGKELGRADVAEVLPVLDALDETWTSWMRDIRLGKGRIIAPSYMLEAPNPTQPGAGAVFDLDREVFTGLNAPPSADGNEKLTVEQFAIRTAEHSATARELTLQALRSSGYSAQTFGYADEAAATATEVHARERRSASTREKKTRYWGAALSGLLEALTAVDTARFAGRGVVRPTVEFPAAAQPSLAETAGTVSMLKAAQAASTEVRVRLVHPDWTDDQVAEEVARITDEESLSVPDPFAAPSGEEPGAGLFGEPQDDEVQA